MSKYCRSCGVQLTIAEERLDDKLGHGLSVCLPCLKAALKEIKKEELVKFYYYQPDEIDV